MDNLTPTLNLQQLQQNITALQKGGQTNDKVQAYVNNYQKGSDGSYTLKVASKTPTQNFGNNPQGTAAYIPGEISNAATGIGQGVIATAQQSSDLVNTIKNLIPEHLQTAIASQHPTLAAALGLVSKISPAISNLEKSIGGQQGGATTPIGSTQQVGKVVGQVGSALFPAEGAATALVDTGKSIASQIGEKIAQKPLQTAIEAVTPKMTGKTLATHYMQDFGKEAQQAGLLNPQKAGINSQIEKVATNLQDVLTSKNPLTNLKNLGADMTKTESQLSNLLSTDKTPVIKQDITEQLTSLKQQIPQEFQAIKDQKNVFTRVIDYANGIVDKMNKASTGSLNDLRNSRIKFDTQAKLEFPSAFKNGTIDVATPAGRAIKLVRDTMNENLYARTPNGSQLQSLIKREADIFKAAQNIAPKVVGNEGKSILERVVGTIKKHPIITGIGAYEATKHILP